MSTNQAEIAVAIYDYHTQAEAAVKALQRAGFDMTMISIMGRDYHSEEHVVGYLNAGDRARFMGKFGAFWGGLMGLLFGSAILFIPVVGQVVILGPLASALFAGLEGAAVVGGLSALAGALMAIGIPKDSVLRYETSLKADKFFLVVHGDNEQVERAREILATSAPASLDRHCTSEPLPRAPQLLAAPAALAAT